MGVIFRAAVIIGACLSIVRFGPSHQAELKEVPHRTVALDEGNALKQALYRIDGYQLEALDFAVWCIENKQNLASKIK